MENRCNVIREVFERALKNLGETDKAVFGAVLIRVLESHLRYEGMFRKGYEQGILSEKEFHFLVCVLGEMDLRVCDERAAINSLVVWLVATLLEESDFDENALSGLGSFIPVEYVTRLLIKELFPQGTERLN